jgi:hypothetical protein
MLIVTFVTSAKRILKSARELFLTLIERIHSIQPKRPPWVSFCLEYTMNVYVNLKPNNYDGESDLLTVEVPASYTDELLRYVRPIAEQKNINEDKILKDIIKEAVLEIERRNYERKNRKTKKR